jgi:hypothetical protein
MRLELDRAVRLIGVKYDGALELRGRKNRHFSPNATDHKPLR